MTVGREGKIRTWTWGPEDFINFYDPGTQSWSYLHNEPKVEAVGCNFSVPFCLGLASSIFFLGLTLILYWLDDYLRSACPADLSLSVENQILLLGAISSRGVS